MVGCCVGFTVAPLLAAVTVVEVVAVAASASSADLSPTMAADDVVAGGAMDGRAAFSDPRRPVSCSFSLRFSLRACDFEYGARDASNPVIPSTTTNIQQIPFVDSFVHSDDGRARNRRIPYSRVRRGCMWGQISGQRNKFEKQKNYHDFCVRVEDRRHIRSRKSSCLRIRLSFLFCACWGCDVSSASTDCNISSALM